MPRRELHTKEEQTSEWPAAYVELGAEQTPEAVLHRVVCTAGLAAAVRLDCNYDPRQSAVYFGASLFTNKAPL